MIQYIIRRLLLCVVILFGVSLILYGIIRAMPGDYITSMTASNKAITGEMVERLKDLYGLNDSVWQGYLKWLGGALRGDFGTSFLFKEPVSSVIAKRMWVSFSLALPAFILQMIIAIPLGIISATRQYSKTDYAVTVFALVGISLPSFFFAVVLQRVFAVGLQWLPLSGMLSARMSYTGFAKVLDMAYHFILPVTVLTVTSLGGLMRYSRTNMLEVLNADYIRTARAKGLTERTVIYRHAFRNTLIPIVTMVGGMLPGLFSGAIITERIFSIDGLGTTAFKALNAGDIPFIMGFNMFLAVLILLGNLISDILYAVVDPRIRYS